MLTPCQKCLRSFLTLPSAFILSDFVDYTKFSGVSETLLVASVTAFNLAVVPGCCRTDRLMGDV